MKNHPIKILTIFGTRPEVIKLFPVLAKLGQNDLFDSIVVSTSQHREMIDNLLELFSLKVDHDLDIMQDNQSLIEISIRALTGLDPLLTRYKPDLVLVQGDTTSAFMAALAAFYHKIPIGHVEAGLRSFDKMHPYPEEINRRLISPVINLHFAPTIQNAKNLEKEGIDSKAIFITGNTIIDSVLHIAKEAGHNLCRYLPAETMNSHRIILVTAHRRENWGEPLEKLCHALKNLAQAYPDIAIVYPVHLNPNVRATAFSILGNQERVHLIDPLPYGAFVKAMTHSYLIITDSGGIQEEGPSLRKPILVFRKVTERPEGLKTGGVKLVGQDGENVFREVSRLLEDPEQHQSMTAGYNPFGDGNAAQRIVDSISYYFDRGPRPDDFIPTTNSLKETVR
jgi:UDP-N-acetylglucosamine 2-epimerase (non-hydrolysing)